MKDDDEQALEKSLAEAEAALDELRAATGQGKLYPGPRDPAAAQPPLCSFCGRGINQVKRMIQGGQACICDGCIKLVNEVKDVAPDP